RESRWSRSIDWCYWDKPLLELDGLILGIVGYGRIGQAVGALGRAFGMSLLANARTVQPATPLVTFVDVETLFRQSDVVSLRCPLSPAENRRRKRPRFSFRETAECRCVRQGWIS